MTWRSLLPETPTAGAGQRLPVLSSEKFPDRCDVVSELSLHPDLDQALFLAGVALLYVLLAVRVAPAVRAVRQPAWLWPVLAVVVVGGLSGAHIYGEAERTRIRSMLQGIAPAYADAMVEMGLLSMGPDTRADDPAYLRIIDIQKRWLASNPAAADIYVLMLRPDGRILHVVHAETDFDGDGRYDGEYEGRTPIGAAYDDSSGEIRAAFASKGRFSGTPYSDPWGDWVSAYVWLWNEAEQSPMLVGVDYPASQWLGSIARGRRLVLAIFTLLAAVGLAAAQRVRLAQAELEQSRIAQEVLRQERLRADAASSAKSEFLASMSHEIRTPLNGVIGMLELMRADARVGELRPELNLAYFSARSLLDILNDVLDFSKIDAGRLEVELLPVFFPSLVEEAMRFHAPVTRSRGLAFSSRIDPAVQRTMLLDPLRMRQVFNNLLANAIKFTPQGAIELRVLLTEPATDAEPMLRVEVKDTGIGITADKRELIFGAFTQADQSTSRRYGGSGLGLAICQRLIGLMGGRIGVESLVGAGSIFWFELPARFVDVEPVPIGEPLLQGLPVEAAPAVVVSVAATRESGASADLLVVEDNEVNQLVILGMLKRLGYSYELAADGVQALDRLARSRYRGVLMDVHLPLLDGLEVTRRFRQREGEAARLPIIALTANAHPSDRDECLGAGMDDFLDKPIQIKDLDAKLAHWLVNKGHTSS